MVPILVAHTYSEVVFIRFYRKIDVIILETFWTYNLNRYLYNLNEPKTVVTKDLINKIFHRKTYSFVWANQITKHASYSTEQCRVFIIFEAKKIPKKQCFYICFLHSDPF